jgi:ribosomal protein S13
MGFHTRFKFIKRFELNEMSRDKTARLSCLSDVERLAINLILSRAACMNHPVSELQYLNLLRLFMNRSMRGRSQALGKPSHGQRTWSNA